MDELNALLRDASRVDPVSQINLCVIRHLPDIFAELASSDDIPDAVAQRVVADRCFVCLKVTTSEGDEPPIYHWDVKAALAEAVAHGE